MKVDVYIKDWIKGKEGRWVSSCLFVRLETNCGFSQVGVVGEVV